MKIPYGRQHITEEDISEVVRVLGSDFLTQGPAIQAFEDEFSEYIGSKYSVAVANGTAALHLAVMALGVKPGKKVITTPITFAASSNSVLYEGGLVDFADIDRETYLLDPNQVEDKIKKAPQEYDGIIPVNLTGLPCQLEDFRAIADRYGLWILEDACHSPGAYVGAGDQRWQAGDGKLADASIFSFHPVKHIAAGEGGMITTRNADTYKKLAMLRTHGITKDPDLLQENHGGWYYEMHELGYNYRLTDFQAALGLSQLRRADQGLEKRNEIAAYYDDRLSDLGIVRQARPKDRLNAFHLYVIEAEDRLGLYNHLRSHGIYAQVHYIPVHTLPYYKNLGWKKGDFPKAEDYYSKCLSIPMFPTLERREQDYVIETIKHFFGE